MSQLVSQKPPSQKAEHMAGLMYEADDVQSGASGRDILTCQLRVANCQFRVASCQLIIVSCELISVSCELRVVS